MAVNANIEWMVEAALISVLGNNADLSACRIVHEFDATPVNRDDVYPVVTVSCDPAGDEEWSSRLGFVSCYAEITVFTHMDDDATGVTCGSYIGAVRDSLHVSNLEALLNAAESGLTVHGVRIEPGTTGDEEYETRRHIRSVTLELHASAS